MSIPGQMRAFASRYGKEVVVDGTRWRYYKLGAGRPVLWLTGGLRRAAFGFGFLVRLGAQHTVIAPDLPPVRTIGELLKGLDVIMRSEGVDTFVLAGQSYGGLLAQAYVAHRIHAIERLILSSSGPADYGKAWLVAEYAAIALARVLPQKLIKKLLVGGFMKIVTVPAAERAEWRDAIEHVLYNELSRADVISHFAVVADVIRTGLVDPHAYRNWTGQVVVLRAENDPTQRQKHLRRFERLFGRDVSVLSMADMGHTAALLDPQRYVRLFEQALQ